MRTRNVVIPDTRQKITLAVIVATFAALDASVTIGAVNEELGKVIARKGIQLHKLLREYPEALVDVVRMADEWMSTVDSDTQMRAALAGEFDYQDDDFDFEFHDDRERSLQ